MNILGAKIRFDIEQTQQHKHFMENHLPLKKLLKLRIYEVTDEFDLFRKYCCTFTFWDIFLLHIKEISDLYIKKIRYRN